MSSRVLRQFLASLQSAGVQFIPHVVPPAPTTSLTAKNRAAHRKSGAASVASGHSKSSPVSHQPVAFSREVHPQKALTEIATLLGSRPNGAEAKESCLLQIGEIVSKCDRCPELVMQRRKTVFGTGDPDAKIMFIGEAPGADEDLQGEPFVGAAGQLLNKIIAACGLTREEIYICNILRCRPPGNRNPLPQEAANCREFLDAQIAIVQPEYIVCWGTIAAQNLLNEKRSVGKLRGSFLQHGAAKVLCTYHPSYLLRYPEQKKEVWADMKILMADMGVEL